MPVTRPVGQALLVGNPASRAPVLGALERLGFGCTESDDPYSAMMELCRRPLVYRAMILSLSSLYREELNIIRAVKRRYPHVEVWLAHTDGRQSSMAEAMRLGADGLIADDGLHRVALPAAGEPPLSRDEADALAPEPLLGPMSSPPPSIPDSEPAPGEPILTADELRALLQEQPAIPPAREQE